MSEDEYNVNDLGVIVGSYSRCSPYEGLTDEQADVLQAELEAQDLRKLPLGFRAALTATPTLRPPDL